MQAAVTAAAASAASATTQAINAAASAVDADESEDLAYEHEQNAAEWATIAQGAANSSQAYSSASAAARDAALAALDSFDDRYLGQKDADPVTDNDGNTLVAGALYFNNQDNVMKVYEGSVWVAAYASLSGALLVANNLSDVASVSASRTNLGLGTAATTNSTAYATAAQGTNADTAFGWGNHASAGYAADSAVVKLTGDQTVAGTKTFSSTVSGSITGNAGTVTNGVYTTGDQTIGGTKTFSSTITGSISGNAGTVTNGVYTSGDQTIAGTKTFSSNPALSAGTANGVTYLNGSKVLTSGSALTFDGATLNVNSGAAGLTTNFNSTNASGLYVRFQNSGTSIGDIGAGAQVFSGGSAGDFGLSSRSGSLVFGQNSTEQMRLTSTGLGIGTSSPSYKLQVGDGSADTRALFLSNNNFSLGVGRSTGTIGKWIGSPSSNVLTFSGNDGTEQMRLDSSGNLGIGTSSVTNPLTVSKTGVDAGLGIFNIARIRDGSGNKGVSIGYLAGSNTTVFTSESTGAASSFGWEVYSGSAWSQAMTLDSSGNLGLGVTPTTGGYGKGFQISQASNNLGTFWTQAISDNDHRISITDNAKNTGVGAWAYFASSQSATMYQQATGQHQWYTAPTGTAGDAITFTQAMTLDASGNLLVGTTSSGGKITAAVADNASFQTAASFTNATNADFNVRIKTSVTDIGCSTSTPLTFSTGNTERARIDSSGGFVVGASSAGSSDTDSFSFAPGVKGIDVNHVTGSASGSLYARFNYANGTIGSITQSGTTAVLYNLTSDQRLKKNIQDAAPASALIDAIQVREYNWKSDGSFQRYGFIAQELLTVAPEAVHQPADPEAMMAVDYSKLVPMLVKEIQSLRQRLAAAGI
jgi:hypothetical protein